MAMQDYLKINKNLWNRKTEVHTNSEFYDLDKFKNGQSSLNSIELDLLGDIKGKSVLHLQCHFGQDTISLARMGAKVTGVDLSDKAIDFAKELANKENTVTEFICCDVYDLPNHLNQKFDIVFTSYGTIGWLPDLDKWANVVNHFLKPKGEFIFVEFHPYIWIYDNDFKEITYNYFKDEPIVEMIESTYTQQKLTEKVESISWNHGLSEVLTALLNKRLSMTSFQEFDYSPYNIFSQLIEVEPGKFQFQQFGNKIPLVYALKAKK